MVALVASEPQQHVDQREGSERAIANKMDLATEFQVRESFDGRPELEVSPQPEARGKVATKPREGQPVSLPKPVVAQDEGQAKEWRPQGGCAWLSAFPS